MLQDAVERNLEIIGEAISRILRLKPDITFLMPGELWMPEILSFTDTTTWITPRYGRLYKPFACFKDEDGILLAE